MSVTEFVKPGLPSSSQPPPTFVPRLEAVAPEAPTEVTMRPSLRRVVLPE